MKNVILCILALPVIILVWPIIGVSYIDNGEQHNLVMAAAIGAEIIYIATLIGIAMWWTL
jgi:hypothetical protein